MSVAPLKKRSTPKKRWVDESCKLSVCPTLRQNLSKPSTFWADGTSTWRVLRHPEWVDDLRKKKGLNSVKQPGGITCLVMALPQIDDFVARFISLHCMKWFSIFHVPALKARMVRKTHRSTNVTLPFIYATCMTNPSKSRRQQFLNLWLLMTPTHSSIREFELLTGNLCGRAK